MISIREAEKQTGKSKGAITKAIKSGRLSASKNEKGEWRIEPVELFRVYEAITNTSPEEPDAYQKEVDLLRVELARVMKEAELWHEQADSWREQAEKVTIYLTYQPEKRSLLGRLLN